MKAHSGNQWRKYWTPDWVMQFYILYTIFGITITISKKVTGAKFKKCLVTLGNKWRFHFCITWKFQVWNGRCFLLSVCCEANTYKIGISSQNSYWFSLWTPLKIYFVMFALWMTLYWLVFLHLFIMTCNTRTKQIRTFSYSGGEDGKQKVLGAITFYTPPRVLRRGILILWCPVIWLLLWFMIYILGYNWSW